MPILPDRWPGVLAVRASRWALLFPFRRAIDSTARLAPVYARMPAALVAVVADIGVSVDALQSRLARTKRQNQTVDRIAFYGVS